MYTNKLVEGNSIETKARDGKCFSESFDYFCKKKLSVKH